VVIFFKLHILLTKLTYTYSINLRTKRRLLPCTALGSWRYRRQGVCLLCGTKWILKYNSGYFFTLAAPRLWRSFPELSLSSPAFHPISVHVAIVVNKLALIRVFVRVLRLSLPISFHQWFKLIPTYTMLLSDGQTSEPGNLPAVLYRKSAVGNEKRSIFPFFPLIVFVSPRSIHHSTNVPCSSSYSSYQKRTRRSLWSFKQSNVVLKKMFCSYFVV
jgi:hypothetical protein